MPLNIVIIGTTGKMGKFISDRATQDSRFSLVGGIGNLSMSSIETKSDFFVLAQQGDILIDFSHRDSLIPLIEIAKKLHKPLVIGTTGYTQEDFATIKNASQSIPIFYSANFSLGIAITKRLCHQLASFLKDDLTVDIVETHHKQKKDSPSGTALALASSMESAFDNKKKVTTHSLRGGTVVGDHSIHFYSDDEIITIEHRAQSRAVFAKGALHAALFLQGKKPNLYSMEDILKETHTCI